MPSKLGIAVLVPSYRRMDDLGRCLQALMMQDRAPDQVVVVARAGDTGTLQTALDAMACLPLDVVIVSEPGVVKAMNAGLAQCRVGSVVAITDDDAVPWPDWLGRIEKHFLADPKLGGVGGRDWVQNQADAGTDTGTVVGRVTWFGRVIGNHHLGIGGARDVDVLKGVNGAYRIDAIRPFGFDLRLRGEGAQVHWEMILCLSLKRAGWRLIYDPAIAVDHYPAPRFDRDQRHRFDPQATADSAYNFRLALREISPTWKRMAAFFWHYVVGTRDEPGLVNLLRLLGRREQNALLKFRAAHGLVKLETE